MEELLVAEIDLSDIAFLKQFVDAGGHYSRPEILRLIVDEEPKVPLERRNPTPPPIPVPVESENPVEVA